MMRPLLFEAISNRIEELESLLSYYRKDSQTTLLNDAAGQVMSVISNELLTVLSLAQRVSCASDNAFHIGIASLKDLWKAHAQMNKIPSQKDLSILSSLLSKDCLILDIESSQAMIKDSSIKIDLGGIAKGFAIDECMKIYKQYGIHSAFINFGGNLKAIGKNEVTDEDWVVGIQHPKKKRGNFLATIKLSNQSIATSGAYERYLLIQDKKYHHILDPRTGYPSQTELVSVSIISKHAIDTDAWSTACFVLGLEKAIALIRKQTHLDAILITKDNEIHLTKTIVPSFTLIQSSENFRCFLIDEN